MANWNPNKKGANVTLSNGNITATISGREGVFATSGKTTGKYYFEVIHDSGPRILSIGIANEIAPTNATWVFQQSGVYYGNEGRLYGFTGSSTSGTPYGSTFTVGDVIGVAFDVDAKTIEYFKNGVSQGQITHLLTGSQFYAFISRGSTSGTITATGRFSINSFQYPIPAGFSPYDEYRVLVYNNGWKKWNSNLLSWVTVTISNPTETDFNSGMSDYELSLIPETAWSQLIGEIEINAFTSNQDKTEVLFNVETEPFTLSQEWDGKQIQIIEFTDDANKTESSILLETEPFMLEDYLSGIDKLDVLYYTDDTEVSSPTLEIEANYSPLDELGDFDIVTWVEDDKVKPTVGINALPIGQVLFNENTIERYIDIESFVATIESSNADASLIRFFLSFDGGLSWKSFRNNYWKEGKDADLTNKSLVRRYGMSANDLMSIPESEINRMVDGEFRIGYYIEERAWTDENEKITEVSYKGTAYVDDVKFSDLAFYILNTKATINIIFAGNKVQGVLDDEDKGKVQYRILLNGDPYFPVNGEFTRLLPSPFQLNVVVDDKRIKFGEQNSIIVEFKDYWGEVDSWSSTFIGTHSGLVFTDEMGNFFTTAFGEVLKYLDFGEIIAGQTTLDQKVILKNNIGYPVKNVQLTASYADSDVAIEMSKEHSPFESHSELLYPDVLDINEEIPFYVRISTKLTASPNANGEFEIRLNADRVI
ncbi:hypothetical protein D3P07_00690 [Paenibacillus sp. 1011MAR3C5]|uniref:SPRY domain-containing protein n=1 Tax=Paenibacillus sp. 1011MAR3C5 TaxID=1675787 RepID=UPI000E6CEFC7|nr:SPRY domain-containing protein [Paenibacillus sp. 1011MAR3C5]RJE90661.1 hypothetical protein D3P07_00690 [Paenibacillus sp. 1011MAR3C5]